jgi:hypothetical protein
VLAVTLAGELDHNIAFAFGLLQGNDAAESPSVALASELAGIGSPTDGYRAIGPSSTLRRHDLIGVVAAGRWATRRVRVADSVVKATTTPTMS